MGAQRSPSDDKEVTEQGALFGSVSSLSELYAPWRKTGIKREDAG
jgi:hypothetical protein